jgi:predicted amidohydrolase YtcJ
MDDRTQVLMGGDVRLLDGAAGRAEALAWRAGRLLGSGTVAEILQLAGPGAQRWDAKGATVLPGFIDAHHHPSFVALGGGGVRLVAPLVHDIPSCQRTLAEAAATLPKGRWLLANGWDELALDERRPPTRRELDDAAPDHPVLAIHYSCHRAVANSRALAAAGIDRGTTDPPGGQISRRRGEPDGLLIERAISAVEALARASILAQDEAGYFARLALHHRALLAAGLTRVVDATVPGDLLRLYRRAAERGELLLPTVALPVSTAGYLEPPGDALEGPVTGAGTDPLTIGPLKLVFDGGPTCAMCLGWGQATQVFVGTWAKALGRGSLDPLRIAFSTQPRLGRQIRTGVRLYDRASAVPVTRAAVERGFGLAVHAMGNEAVGLALDAYAALGPALHGAGLPRIEHATFLDRTLVARLADQGVAVAAQPSFLALPAFAGAPRIPGLSNTPLRWLLDAGVKVAGSSDHPCVTFAPLDGIRAAVARGFGDGGRVEPDQAITLEEALTLYTRTAAEVSGCLDRCGTLEPGKRADLVVLDGPLTDRSLSSIQVRATVLGGTLEFGALSPALD